MVLFAATASVGVASALQGCAAEKKNLREATALWTEYCARCHGADGKGEAHSIDLYPKLDLSLSAMIQTRDRILIHDRITRGYGAMPGYLGRMEPEEIGRLVNRCLEFAAAPKSAPTEGPR